MLESLLDCKPSNLVFSADQVLNEKQRGLLEQFADRRISGEPLQYILGSTEFFGLKLAVTPEVLVPRPETEGLVQHVLDFLPLGEYGPVADIGTGSGCIALALAKERPRLQVAALDISAPALDVARENAARLGLGNVEFFQGDLTAPLRNFQKPLRVLVSNPPYVGFHEKGDLPTDVVDHEPHLALFSEGGGLAVIERLILEAPEYLSSGGMLAMEIGETQGSDVMGIFSNKLWSSVQIEKDLTGRDRYALAVFV